MKLLFKKAKETYNSNKYVKIGIRVLISAALIIFLVSHENLNSIKQNLLHFDLTYLFFSELVAFFVQPIVMQFLQKFEYEADAFSKQLLHQGEPLASALKKIIIHELGNINIHPWYEKIYYSHPSMIRRIRALNG